MSLSSRRRSSAGRTVRARGSGWAWGTVTAVVAVASAVICVRAVPHWAGLVVCGAGVILLTATVVERFVRGRVRARPGLQAPRAAEPTGDAAPHDGDGQPDHDDRHLDQGEGHAVRDLPPVRAVPRPRRAVEEPVVVTAGR